MTTHPADSGQPAIGVTVSTDPIGLSAIDPEMLDDKEFVSYISAVNTAFAAAQRQIEHATIAKGQMLTERVCRTIEALFPDAAYLDVGVLETFYTDADGNRDHTQPEIAPLLVPSSVLNDDREPIGSVDPYSPVHHYLEQLTSIMDIEPCRLNLLAREWFYPHADDDVEPDMRLTGDDFTGDDSLGDDSLGFHWNP